MKSKKEINMRYPTARLKGLKEFMSFVQEPDWKPEIIDAQLLKRLGMAKGREGETVFALQFIGVIDEAGIPTTEFDNLKNEYSTTLSRLIKENYRELFKLLPVRMMNQEKLVNFFGEPIESAEYKAKFFVWLCEQAGINLPNVETKFHRARFDKKKDEE
ncbi:MAG: hypothetical protein C4583_15870 [Anaerolineaceae bacterium]|nr:MAG: hypothetical protein C4583_15870 [Anaerolineaceae bacterium]